MKLKFQCSGTIIINSEIKKQLAKDLKISVRTIELELKKLYNLNWIGCKKRTYYLRSFEFIQNGLPHQNSTGVRMEIKDIKTIKGFCVGTLIGYFIKHNIYKAKKNGEKGKLQLLQKRGKSSKRTTCNTSSDKLSPYSFANSILAKVLGCSMSTASLYKKEALKHKYIKVKKVFRDFNYDSNTLNLIKKAMPEDSHRITVNKKKVVYRLPDIVDPLMRFKPRKKSRKKSI